MDWRPIETAPKDGTRILLGCSGMVIIGSWSEEKYARRSRPYWTNDAEHWRGVLSTRGNQPKYWMPLPMLPEEMA
jgi:hypothetical protein